MTVLKPPKSASFLHKLTDVFLKKTYPHRRCIVKYFFLLWIVCVIAGVIWYYLHAMKQRRQASLSEQRLLRTKKFIEELFDEQSESDQYCQIMHPLLLDPVTLLQIPQPDPIRCNWQWPPLTFIGSDGILHFNTSAFQQMGYDPQSLRCVYRSTYPPYKKQNLTLYSPLAQVTGNDVPSGDFVAIKCSTFNGTKVYTNIHAYPQRLPKSMFPQRLSSRKLSVLVFSLDSLSRLSMMQQLPKTYRFLTHTMRAIVLRGMTKVSDGSWANIASMLTGKLAPELKLNFKNPAIRNSYPIIWRNYSMEQYVTFFAEDVPSWPIPKGVQLEFIQQPTDHFLHPFWVGMMSTQMYDESSWNCFGHKPMHQLHLNYVRNFVINYASTSYFAFSYITGKRQSCLNCLRLIDDDLSHFFEDLFYNGFLDDTIIFVTADQGVSTRNFGSSTTVNRLESNTPICAVYLPLRVCKQFPDVAENLMVNSRRLTSSFDIHATLVDILNYGTQKSERLGINKEHVLAQGRSLFGSIPKNRSCSEAGISLRYCVCGAESQVSEKDKDVVAVADAIIDKINRVIERFPDKCAILSLKSICSAFRVVDRVFDQITNVTFDDSLLKVIVEAFPGGGVFEGIGRFNKNHKITIITEIFPINLSSGHNTCVPDTRRYYDISKYCYCKKIL